LKWKLKANGRGNKIKKTPLEQIRYNKRMKHDEKLNQLKNQALDLMADAGFALTSTIDVALDPKLPYMGYTTEQDGKPLIVVSGDALKSNMALNLLIHELSHVYRIQSGHPSHNSSLLTSIVAWVMHGRVVEPYQESILFSILNNMQDVYADDISFKIFAKQHSSTNLNEFFMGWIHEPVKATTPEKKWQNAEKLVSAAFAQANLERHHVTDTDQKVAKAIESVLQKYDKPLSQNFPFFKEFMVDMPEEITDREFESLLTKYLSEFVKLTKI